MNTVIRLLFLTEGNLGSDPRCMKGVWLGRHAGFNIHVVSFTAHDHTDAVEEKIVENDPEIVIFKIDLQKRNVFRKAAVKALFVTCRALSYIFPGSAAIAARARGIKAIELITFARKHYHRTNIGVTHGPNTMYAGYVLNREMGSDIIADIDGYYPDCGESLHNGRLMKTLLKKTLPKTVYSTYSSSLIRDRLVNELGIPEEKTCTINNFFTRRDFIKPLAVNHPKLRLVWFSQEVTFGRGLENFLPAAEKVKNHIELTLIGTVDPLFEQEWLKGKGHISLPGWIPRRELHKRLAGFDVGVSVDDPGTSSRDLNLSTKLLSYYQSGLFILASDTTAHRTFFEENPGIGERAENSVSGMLKVLNELISIKEKIRADRQHRFEQTLESGYEFQAATQMRQWNTLNLYE
ncbi:MAG: hypothetical protein V4616_05025 [Bacteroidota bacterium]